MIECPPFKKETPIYFASLHVVFAITIVLCIFVSSSMIWKCPEGVKSVKVQFLTLQFFGLLIIFMVTEGLRINFYLPFILLNTNGLLNYFNFNPATQVMSMISTLFMCMSWIM